jgi:REP element-mobilizing transposase RayT
LRYSPVRFTGEQARAIASGFARAAEEGDYTIHALAVLPDHAHLVIARHARHVDRIAAHLKAKATAQLAREELHPLTEFASPKGRVPSPWARRHWCPFIDSREHMEAAIEYVQRNPIKAGLRAQRWSCVTPYDG